jgi:hypothetical protein
VETHCCESSCANCPFTAKECQSGYRYWISILQVEFSPTQVLARPVAGRVFFGKVIRENLDSGRRSKCS